MTKPPPDFFNKEAALKYDERNSKLSDISDGMHFLIRLVLRDLPPHSKVLCVGVGTGAEIFSLAQAFPQWTFVGVEPSLEMLEVCRERVKQAGITNRCEFFHGFIQDLKGHSDFDAALSVLVGHFVKREEKLDFFKNISARLRTGGYFVNTEISFDLDSAQFPLMLKAWEGVQGLMGATPESLATLPVQLREMLSIFPPTENEKLLQQSGFALPVRFFQALMICGWFAKK